jgi:phospholipid/cholesterol/gamma-HCH transport system permease protein
LENHQESSGALRLTLHGRLDSTTTGLFWRQTQAALKDPTDVILDVSDIEYIDISGVSYLIDLQRRQEADGRSLEIEGLRDEFDRLMKMFDPASLEPPGPSLVRRLSLPESVGRSTLAILEETREMVAFVGEVTISATRLLRRKVRLRWPETFLVAESAGLSALPVISMMGLILGLILAFQGAIPLRRYGGEVLVADMVIMAMFREMGPLFTAIILAARSSSAFAAELGTMKINEEIDALTTMGLDPVPFLAMPRILAGVVVAPILTVFMNLMGLVGGGLVFLSMGFTPATYYHRLLLRGDAVDFSSGLFRALVFGAIIAGIGCMQGLRTGRGARAVGESTTSAVVSSIVAIIVADGLLAVLFYKLGI